MIAQVNQNGPSISRRSRTQAWSAKQRLNLVKQGLRQNEYKLHVAKGNLHAAQQQVMRRLYSLYVNGSPSTIDVIAGANSVSQMIDRAESAQVLSNQDAALGRQALSFEHRTAAGAAASAAEGQNANRRSQRRRRSSGR